MKIVSYAYGAELQPAYIYPITNETITISNSGRATSSESWVAVTRTYSATTTVGAPGYLGWTTYTTVAVISQTRSFSSSTEYTRSGSEEFTFGESDNTHYFPVIEGYAGWPNTTTSSIESYGTTWGLSTAPDSAVITYSGYNSSASVPVVSYDTSSRFRITLGSGQSRASDISFYGTFFSAPAGYVGPASNLSKSISSASMLYEYDTSTYTATSYYTTGSQGYWGGSSITVQNTSTKTLTYSVKYMKAWGVPRGAQSQANEIVLSGSTWGGISGDAYKAAGGTGSTISPQWAITASEHPGIRNVISYPSFTGISSWIWSGGAWQYIERTYYVSGNYLVYITTMNSRGGAVETTAAYPLIAVNTAETSRPAAVYAGWEFAVSRTPYDDDMGAEYYAPQRCIIPGGQAWSVSGANNYVGDESNKANYKIITNSPNGTSSNTLQIGTDFQSVFQAATNDLIVIEAVEWITPSVTYSAVNDANGGFLSYKTGYYSGSYVL